MDSTSQPPVPRRGSLNQRLFASRVANRSRPDDPSTAARKRALFAGLHGMVLEIGPGTGKNLAYFPAEITWVGVEPNPFMLPYLLQAIRGLGWPAGRFQIEPGDPQGDRLPVEDESVDAVVSTMVLCSVPHPAGSLQEVLRVLKPGGEFLFIEHVAASCGTGLRLFQDLLQPVWSLAAEGCHPNRETWNTISRAGFARVEIEHYRFPGGHLVGPRISGRAVKG